MTYSPLAGRRFVAGPLFVRGPISTEEVQTEAAAEPLLEGLGLPHRVLVAGGTGFVGRHLVRRLQDRGHTLRALARGSPGRPWAADVEMWTANIGDEAAVRGAAEGCDVVVHLVGIAWPDREQSYDDVHVHGTRVLLAEARRAGVRRFVFVSTVGASPRGSAYFRTKLEAEREVRGSDLEFVIFRPSVIYGPGDKFTTALVQLLRRLPVFPVLGLKVSRLQPVAIEDVAEALVQAVERTDLTDRTFEVAGPERLEFVKIVRIVAATIGVRRPIVKLPGVLSAPALRVARLLGLPLPITADQLAMFRGASVLRKRANPLRSVFRLEPLPFRAAIEDYL